MVVLGAVGGASVSVSVSVTPEARMKRGAGAGAGAGFPGVPEEASASRFTRPLWPWHVVMNDDQENLV
ncbi:hypothetical protein Tdes44962_MAKER09368 [Teratosphaeria destructans]|uniref:Uncharacterized protein n=1 Tax=Teratosphaeria destructans TaxID=418781 RepID=A0A9W7W3E1_9PEZI|nr:hypothetical protein Tdes44962_MAKER09368 [Teratosphaeria destructans]